MRLAGKLHLHVDSSPKTNSTKDRQLWKLISKASNSKDLDWEDMSARFNVSLPFLLQQAAWLYERHFESMKAQMKKLGGGLSSAPSPTPLSDGGSGTLANGLPMQRTGSRGTRRSKSIQ